MKKTITILFLMLLIALSGMCQGSGCLIDIDKIEVEENWTKKSSVGTYSLRLTIKDTNIGQNGKGMTKEELEKITKAFFTTKKNGTGLGVYLSNEIIKAHNGNIKYSSVKDKGTKAVVTIPK